MTYGTNGINDMRPYCSHMKKLGWDKMASEKVEIKTYKLTRETREKQNEAKNRALKCLANHEPFFPTLEETKIYNLSKNAKSVANPQLIIDEFDVKASHAAAVGNLDEQSIYYLMSRGIEKNKAKEMIVLGMVDEILIDIFDVEEQNKVNNSISKKIKE